MAYIEKAVASVLCQTYSNWELLICDDGSTDGTSEYLKTINDHRVKSLHNKTNIGYLRTKNYLHATASGEFITQLDHDDLYNERKIEYQVIAAIRENAEIVACGYQQIDAQGKVLNKYTCFADRFFRHPLDQNPLPFWFPSLLVHRNVYNKIGLFDEYFDGALGDDHYWLIRASEKFAVYCLSDILYSYRYAAGSITNDCTTKRKLIIPALIQHLRQQRSETGLDSLETRDYDYLHRLEHSLLSNNSVMHTHLLVRAAKCVDHLEFRNAFSQIRESFNYRYVSLRLFRTAFYLIRRLTSQFFVKYATKRDINKA